MACAAVLVTTWRNGASACTASASTGTRPSGVSKASTPGSARPLTGTRCTGPSSTTRFTMPRAAASSS